MFVVEDSMVLIHLAKLSLLESSCDFFGEVAVPELVFKESVLVGKSKGFEDAVAIGELIQKNKIIVKKISNKALVEKANQFNIFGGEAEALALYWQENADILATDDDNVRNKKEILGFNVIGTPAILLALFKDNVVDSPKAVRAVNSLRKIGWFNSEVLDRILCEVEKNE